MSEDHCPVCGSTALVATGPLTISGASEVVTVASGRQCTLCGRLEVVVPQPVLVRWYPPNVRFLTRGRRELLRHRHKERRRRRLPGPSL